MPEGGEDTGGESKWVPELDMEFETDEKAYEFYNDYAKKIGFSVRKQNLNRSSRGHIRSRRYVCYREGYRRKHRSGAYVLKSDKRDERTGCRAHMYIKITYTGAYKVYDFEPKHNHALVPQTMVHLLRSQKLLNKAQNTASSQANDSEVPPQATKDFLSSQVVPADDGNYLQSKRKNGMKPGDSGVLLKYLQQKQAENPRFFYAIQLDEDDRLTNVFLADGRSRADYEYFGDVVCLDMTYRTNGYVRPFASFVGANHHKQIVVFGAALLYDETEESFKWLMKNFKEAMSGNQPRVILTDKDTAVSNAIAAVWPGTVQRLCVWHMYQHATKQLRDVFQGSESFKRDFSRCMYDYEDEEEFITAWQEMLKKYDLAENAWLTELFENREQWALPYGRGTFYADMKSMQRNEVLNRLMKKHLSPDLDLMTFFKQYDKLVEDRRYRELEADHRTSQTTPKVPHSRLLKLAATIYTAEVFEMFEKEFGMYMDCTLSNLGETGTVCGYEITYEETGKTSIVKYDSSDGTISCTCRKFEFVGIQCCHVLKVLDYRNIKELPQGYLLRRWRKDAKSGIVRDHQENVNDPDPKIAFGKRFNSSSRFYNQILARASESGEAYEIAMSEAVKLMEKLEQVFQRKGHGKRPVDPPHSNSPEPNGSESPITPGEVSAHQDNHKVGSRARNKDVGHGHKRKRGRKGQPDGASSVPTDSEPHSGIPYHQLNFVGYHPMQIPASSPFMEFGIGSAPRFSGSVHASALSSIYQQGFHGMTQFNQGSSISNLQQPLHHGNTQFTQDGAVHDMHPDTISRGRPQVNHLSSDES